MAAAVVVVVMLVTGGALWRAGLVGPLEDVDPLPTAAVLDVPVVDGHRCLTSGSDPAQPCVAGPDDAAVQVALVGDETAEQLLPAFASLAASGSWRLVTDLQAGCPLVDVHVARAGASSTTDCREGYERRLAALVDDPAVTHVVLAAATGAGACEEAECGEPTRDVLQASLRATMRALHRAGKLVVAVRELPTPGSDVLACVAEHRRDVGACAFSDRDRQGALAQVARDELVPVVDLVPQICQAGSCPAVSGGTLRYRPDGMLTATFAATLTDALGSALGAVGLPATAPATQFGAHALGAEPARSAAGRPVPSVEWMVPPAATAMRDEADVYVEGCHQNQKDAEPLTCRYGDPHAQVVIALVGDSHAAQWQPALRAVAEERGWLLRTYTKSACLFADVTVWNGAQEGPYTSCRDWTVNVVRELREDPPTVLIPISTGRYSTAVDGTHVRDGDAVVEAMVRTWSAVAGTGAQVVPIADTPWSGRDVRRCVLDHLDDLTACAFDRADAVAGSGRSWQERAVAQVDGAALVDLTDVVCPGERCAPVIGNALVWRDGHHLTATYSLTTAPLVGRALDELIGSPVG